MSMEINHRALFKVLLYLLLASSLLLSLQYVITKTVHTWSEEYAIPDDASVNTDSHIVQKHDTRVLDNSQHVEMRRGSSQWHMTPVLSSNNSELVKIQNSRGGDSDQTASIQESARVLSKPDAQQKPSCQQVKTSKAKLPLVALAAAPGAGSTWAKHLLQQTTGIYSGSIYYDSRMDKQEFKYTKVFDGSVSPIKTHMRADGGNRLNNDLEYDKAILMYRNPYQTIKANYNRRKAGKTGIVTVENFSQKGWLKLVRYHRIVWLEQMVSWLRDPRPIFLMKYDHLKSNLTYLLKEAATFLDLSTTDDILKCVKENSEGSYHRVVKPGHKDLLVFPDDEVKLIDENIRTVEWYLARRCPRPPWCLPISEVSFQGEPVGIFPKR